jgi:hypothetical protein
MGEIPEDVMEFVRECERRGRPPRLVAVERDRGRYDVWVRTLWGWKYAGEAGAEEAFREKDEVVCGRLTCSLFWRDAMTLAYDRQDRRVHEPREEREVEEL